MAKIKTPEAGIQVTQVVLFNNGSGEIQTFDFAWAERILQLQEKYTDKPFSLPGDSDFGFVKGKLIRVSSPKDHSSTGKGE